MRHVTRTVEEAGPDALEQTADRYGIGSGQHGLMPGLPSHRRAAAVHSLGKRMLEVDGFHHTFAWLHRNDEQVEMVLLDREDQQNKVVKIRRLAQEIERTGADTLLFTTEAWFASEVDSDDPRAALRAGERDDRGEALVTYLLRRDGDHGTWITPFERDANGRVMLRETEEQEKLPHTPLFAPSPPRMGGVAA
jgi:hypothetical protein